MSWDVGVLGPRQALDVQVVTQAAAEMDARVVFEATAAPGIKKNAVISTLVQKPQVTLSINADPTTTQVAVGDVATFSHGHQGQCQKLRFHQNQPPKNLQSLQREARHPGLDADSLSAGAKRCQLLDFLLPVKKASLLLGIFGNFY
jgi:hypothetical protein